MAQVLEKAQAIHDAEKVTAYYEGEEHGVIKGEYQAAVKFANKLLRRSVSLTDIAEDTGLSINELHELQNKLSYNLN